jgi:O-antigen ligase
MPGIIVRPVTNRLIASLRDAPATVPAFGAMTLFVVWASGQAGYPVTRWGPGGMILLALLGVAVVFIGLDRAKPPVALRIALLCFAAYTALSFLSILWASVPGDAWEGANRTLLYLVVFALFACWPQRGASAALLLSAWVLAMIGLAAFVALHVDAASARSLQTMVPFGRLIYPSGYANANAALWLMAFWPALLLTRSRELPPALRGVLAGGAVLLAEVALLSQSRGSLFSTPVMLVLVFALLPGRARTFAFLVPVAIGIAAAAPAVIRVGDRVNNGQTSPVLVHSAVTAMLVASVCVALAVGLAAAIESRAQLAEQTEQRIRTVVGALAVATLIGLLGVALAAVHDPVGRVSHGWDTFTQGYGANGPGDRLTSGLGSNRYDFYRVSLDQFASHPLLGIGVDNFQQPYLAHGRSNETPRYPHSVELRTLSQLGLLGTLLAIAGLGAALLTALRGIWVRSAARSDLLAGAVAAAALSGFAYWMVHGSVDWFWEFAGLGAPALALLGLACALAPRNGRTPDAVTSTAPAGDETPPPRRPGLAAPRRLRVAAVTVLALAMAVSFALPWLSWRQVQSAARVWTSDAGAAYVRLDDAARLNPLSDEADLVAGNIALRLGDLRRAQHEFTQALDRSPRDAYATLVLGAIASAEGHRSAALRLLARAARLNPRDPVTRSALALVASGRRVSLQELGLSVLDKAREFR